VATRRVGVIDLGTNSSRLLVADVDGTRVDEIERRTTVTRMGEGLEAAGRISEAAAARVADAVGDYRKLLDGLGAEVVDCVATSAMRDAANGDELRTLLTERFRVEPRTISGDEEALLTFRGATAARPAGGTSLVIDIGGGSTEYVAGRPGGEPSFHVSTRMGSVRHTERHLHGDPPSAAELRALAEDADAILDAELPAAVREQAGHVIAVAGTATSLAAVEQHLDPNDPERVHGHVLSVATCERVLAELAALPVAERREVPGLHPDRAPTIVAGVAILVRSLHAIGAREVEVSEHDILHGAALEAARNVPADR
jgi:exopolyphosphatase/guanosine-5'-triphosphate,3'-diphosphate pyrophosphatase